jgi:hypothetical protein
MRSTERRIAAALSSSGRPVIGSAAAGMAAMVAPAAATSRSSAQLMWVAAPRSSGSVDTNRVKGRPAARRRGRACAYTDRHASSMVMTTVRSGRAVPSRSAATTRASGSTLYSPDVNSARWSSNWSMRTLLEGESSSPNRP